MTKWKSSLYRKIGQYIIRGTDPFLNTEIDIISWWNKYGEMIVNEFEETVDELGDVARKDELTSLVAIIKSDANIDSDNINVQRIIFHIKCFIEELDREVEYESWESIEREEEAS